MCARSVAGTRRGLFRGDGPAAEGARDAVSTGAQERSDEHRSGTPVYLLDEPPRCARPRPPVMSLTVPKLRPESDD